MTEAVDPGLKALGFDVFNQLKSTSLSKFWFQMFSQPAPLRRGWRGFLPMELRVVGGDCSGGEAGSDPDHSISGDGGCCLTQENEVFRERVL